MTLLKMLRQHLPNWLRPLARSVRRIFINRRPVSESSIKLDDGYSAMLNAERATFDSMAEVHDLPEIFHYWSNKYLRPMFEEHGFSNPDQFFAKYLREASERTGSAQPKFLSIGSGNCDTEVRVAGLLRESGITDFTIECLELSPDMLSRGQADAAEKGVAANLIFTVADFNHWQAQHKYDGVMANQSLHHVLKLENLFDAVSRAMLPRGLFITSDMIGRNGHMRWPESLAVVNTFWKELPENYHYNHQLKRNEELYQNWDCSVEGFEGIRAQDVLPELLKRFHFKLFIAASSVVDVFIDRGFGHNFNVDNARDLEFVDRLHAYDEKALACGELTPTRLVAVMTLAPETGQFSRGLKPEACIRRIDR